METASAARLSNELVAGPVAGVLARCAVVGRALFATVLLSPDLGVASGSDLPPIPEDPRDEGPAVVRHLSAKRAAGAFDVSLRLFDDVRRTGRGLRRGCHRIPLVLPSGTLAERPRLVLQ